MNICFKKINKVTIYISVFILFFSSFVFAKKNYVLADVSNNDYLKQVQELSGAKSAALYSSSLGRFAFFSKEGLSGYAFLSSDYALTKGYRGPTSVLFLLDKSGSKIIDVKLIESTDTRSYIDYLVKHKYFERYKEVNAVVDQKTSVSVGVDAVTGATRSCDAIKISIEKTMEIVKPMISSMQIKQGKLYNSKYQLNIIK